MKQYGLIGFPLSHSFSKKYFGEKFLREEITGCSYELYPIQKIDDLRQLLNAQPNLQGLNVTVPYKEAVLPYLNKLSNEAAQIGAVNCIKIKGNQLTGHNTDTFGFRQSLVGFIKQPPQQTFVLGTGGSSKAVQYVLTQLGWTYIMVSRTPQPGAINYPQIAAAMQQQNLFINTTPLGMFPDTQASPDIPYTLLTANDSLFDLIYNPAETLFLQKGKQQGCQTKNGLEMLELQAEESWRIWTT